MSKQHSEQVDAISEHGSSEAEPSPEVVAAAAARLLVEAARGAASAAPVESGPAAEAPVVDRAVTTAAATVSAATPAAAPAASPDAGPSALRDDPAIAEIHEEIASVQGELNQVSSGVIGLQAHGLRQTGIAALVLAVLIAIAWKVIGG